MINTGVKNRKQTRIEQHNWLTSGTWLLWIPMKLNLKKEAVKSLKPDFTRSCSVPYVSVCVSSESSLYTTTLTEPFLIIYCLFKPLHTYNETQHKRVTAQQSTLYIQHIQSKHKLLFLGICNYLFCPELFSHFSLAYVCVCILCWVISLFFLWDYASCYGLSHKHTLHLVQIHHNLSSSICLCLVLIGWGHQTDDWWETLWPVIVGFCTDPIVWPREWPLQGWSCGQSDPVMTSQLMGKYEQLVIEPSVWVCFLSPTGRALSCGQLWLVSHGGQCCGSMTCWSLQG